MAIEPRRGCGHRKVGGLYIMGGKLGSPCCKMPILLETCPTCNGGIKQARGWQWIDPRPWLKGADGLNVCTAAQPLCPLFIGEGLGEKVGLIWIGTAFYPTPEAFIREANDLGISRRIKAIPRGFKVGESWVFLAHPKVKAIHSDVIAPGDKLETKWIGGVFRVFKPTAIEKIVTATQAKDEAEMAKLRDAGITPVVVPDNDKDHQGSVYEADDEVPTLDEYVKGWADHDAQEHAP